MSIISYKDILDLPRIIVIIIIIIIILLFTYQGAWSQVKNQDEYKQLTTPPDAVGVLNTPDFELKTTCSDENPDLNKCRYFRYALSVKNMEIEYKQKANLIITLAVKDFDQSVMYNYNNELKNYHSIDFDTNVLVSIDQIALSSMPPILDFTDKDSYAGPLWNRQYVKVGDYSIFPATYFGGYFRDPDAVETSLDAVSICKSEFIVNCGKDLIDPGMFTKVSIKNGETKSVSLCNGNVQIDVGPDIERDDVGIPYITTEQYEKFKDCHGVRFTSSGRANVIGKISSDTLGSNCKTGKICCAKISVKNGDKKMYNFGEKVDISFWFLADNNDDGTVNKDDFDTFAERCGGKRWIDNDYCQQRYLGTKTFYVPVQRSTVQSIPIGC